MTLSDSEIASKKPIHDISFAKCPISTLCSSLLQLFYTASIMHDQQPVNHNAVCTMHYASLIICHQKLIAKLYDSLITCIYWVRKIKSVEF